MFLSGPGAGRVAKGIVRGGRSGQAGQQGSLGQVQLMGVLVEIGPGGGLNAVGSGPEKNLVQINGQDFVLS